MASAVYFMCFFTSAVCALLLTRGYLRTQIRLLLWSSLCFCFLALSNLLLLLDLAFFPETDLSLLRTAPALIGVSLLLFGLIWEARQ